jgi:hypothetical protein
MLFLLLLPSSFACCAARLAICFCYFAFWLPAWLAALDFLLFWPNWLLIFCVAQLAWLCCLLRPLVACYGFP